MLIVWILGFSFLGSAVAVGGASLIMALPDRLLHKIVPALLSYAVGTLMAAALLGLIPEAVGELPIMAVMATCLAGLMSFFVLEKIVLWRHCHDESCEIHGAAGPLILTGDALHNFVDGVVIAAGFLSSVPLGIATGLAVFTHELPQEMGDFAILLNSGYSRLRALGLNILSGLATFPGAIVAYLALDRIHGAVPYVLALSAASFIYIALADLTPGLHRRLGLRPGLAQILLILSGIGTIWLFELGH